MFARGTNPPPNDACNFFQFVCRFEHCQLAHPGSCFISNLFKLAHIMKWYDYIAMTVLTPVVIWLFIGWLRASVKHEEEKEAHRRFGGTAPKK